MKLFKYEGYEVVISEEALLLKPFKAVWKRDKNRDKTLAKQELGWIYFMEDPRSDYQTYLDTEERSRQIILGEGMKSDWKPDSLVKEAQQFYAGFKSESALLLEDIKIAIQTLRQGLISQEDLADIDIEKKPLVLKSYAEVISRLTKLTKELDETEKAIARDIANADKVRGSAEKAMFEDD